MRQAHDERPTRPTLADMDAIYDRYVTPLEAEHWGEFVVVAPADGRVMLGTDLRALGRDALKIFGRGTYAFKIGPRTVGRI